MPMLFLDPPRLLLPFRLRGIGVEHAQEPIRRPHGYPQHQWIQVRSGRLRVSVGSSAAWAGPGDGFFLRADEPHAYAAETSAVVDWICFDGPVADALRGSALERSGVYRLTAGGAVERLFLETWNAASSGAPAPRLSACVYELLMTLVEVAAGPGRVSAAEGLGRLEPVLAALWARPAHPWTADEMAELLAVTPQHLGRLFRRILGQPPLDYLVGLRLNRARQLLVERPDLRVHEVGTAVGYSDTNYFIRLFRSREGRTPGDFRGLHTGGGHGTVAP